MGIDLGADPERIDELVGLIFKEIRKLQKKGPTAKEVAEVRLAESRDYETNSRQNGWWLSQLVERYRLGEDPAALARVPDSFAVLTPASVKAAAKLYFNTGRYVQVMLYPETR